MSQDIDEHLSDRQLVLVVILILVWLVGLLQLRERDDSLHSDGSLLVVHAIEQGSLEVLIRVVAGNKKASASERGGKLNETRRARAGSLTRSRPTS